MTSTASPAGAGAFAENGGSCFIQHFRQRLAAIVGAVKAVGGEQAPLLAVLEFSGGGEVAGEGLPVPVVRPGDADAHAARLRGVERMGEADAGVLIEAGAGEGSGRAGAFAVALGLEDAVRGRIDGLARVGAFVEGDARREGALAAAPPTGWFTKRGGAGFFP